MGIKTASFIPLMLLQAVTQLPDDPKEWLCELKLDGWRAIAFKSNGNGTIFFRSAKELVLPRLDQT